MVITGDGICILQHDYYLLGIMLHALYTCHIFKSK